MNGYETIISLKNLKSLYAMNKKVCIFGAGVLGKNNVYELLKGIGFQIEYYFDNNLAPRTYVKEDICVKELDYLYSHHREYCVFLAVSRKFQKQILKQLFEHGVDNVMVIDSITIASILEDIDKEGSDIVKQQLRKIYNDEEYLSMHFKRHTGYELDLEHPRTFNEKLQWLKLYNHNPLYTTLVDKYAVKDYVAGKIGEEYLIPTLGVWDHYDDIDFGKLPNSFVIKCTHDSGSIVLVEDKRLFESNGVKDEFERKLNINYYWMGREWPYKNVSPRIIAEPFMSSPEEMVDYKFMCFDGKPRVIFTCTERFHSDGLKVTFFDLNWKRLNFERHYPASKKKIERPYNLELMVNLAEILSEGIPFVRVDFYEIRGKVYFGEFTFFPGGGMEEFTPLEWDYKLGEWIHLPEKRNI